MGETVEKEGVGKSAADITPKLHRIKVDVRDTSQKLNYAINKQNNTAQRNFISSAPLPRQSSVAN
ncbi:hypothetical protein B5P46_16515 [Rhizobium leguminosarum]|uniref:Uncharacterized protein n=1 Tax=Rhizobium leguminosarum TaxID=384 RepID=A0A4Q1U2F5_RHILE|nr:hypothetical protein B5P46_16515 [Rhizobium leguminosarum]